MSCVWPPAVMELGNATGFDMQLQNRGGLSHEAFLAARNQLLGDAGKNPVLVGVRPNGWRTRRNFASISTGEGRCAGPVHHGHQQTLATAWASSYVNDFIDKGRVKSVYVQADPPSAWSRRTWTCGTCAMRRGAWCRSRRSPGQLDLWLAATHAFQWRSGCTDPGPGRARSQFG